MNKTFQLIWSEARQTWLVAHEAATSRGKPASRAKPLAMAIAGAMLVNHPYLYALDPNTLPTGGQVVAGSANIGQSGSAMTIQQTTNKAILNWNSFNIGSGASVTFQQPGATSVALNRVVGSDASAIYGSLNANGQVFLVNPNGVLFGQSARVDVAGLVASTLNIGDADFMAGQYRFSRNGSTASVINQGELDARYVAMLAPEVRNEGVIVARQGAVALAAGEAVTLNLTGTALVDVQVEKAALDALVENRHAILAEGGLVILSAQAANQLLGKVVNTGEIDAQGMVADGGTVKLLASSDVQHSGSIDVDAGANGKGGTAILLADLANSASRTTVSGSITAQGGNQAGDGGFVETSASHVSIADSAQISTKASQGKTGQWLLDPVDFTIAAANGDITGSALQTLLASNDVTIQTTTGTNSDTNRYGSANGNGDIFVNDTVTWADYKLTLNAHRNIVVNAPMTATGFATLEFFYGQGAVASGNTANYYIYAPVNLTGSSAFKTRLGQSNYAQDTLEYTVIRGASGLQSINTSSTGYYVLGGDIDGSSLPSTFTIGALNAFKGRFDGLRHKVYNLSLDDQTATAFGLFARVDPYTDSNFNSWQSVIRNIGIQSSSISGLSNVGALVGVLNGSIVENAYVDGGTTVYGASTGSAANVGGLVGRMEGAILRTSFANATVTSDGSTVGGLVGSATVDSGSVASSIVNTYAKGSVTGDDNVGGLVGSNINGTISKSYTKFPDVNDPKISVNNSSIGVGQLVGTNGLNGTISDSYYVNGLANSTLLDGVASNTGTNNSLGRSAGDIVQSSNFSGFDFTNVWVQRDGDSSPLLRTFLTPYIVTAVNQTKTADGAVQPTFTSVASLASTPSAVTGSVSFGGASQTATAVGSHAITVSGLSLFDAAAKSDPHGYLISYVNGSLTINAASVGGTTSLDLDKKITEIVNKLKNTGNAAADELTRIREGKTKLGENSQDVFVASFLGACGDNCDVSGVQIKDWLKGKPVFDTTLTAKVTFVNPSQTSTASTQSESEGTQSYEMRREQTTLASDPDVQLALKNMETAKDDLEQSNKTMMFAMQTLKKLEENNGKPADIRFWDTIVQMALLKVLEDTARYDRAKKAHKEAVDNFHPSYTTTMVAVSGPRPTPAPSAMPGPVAPPYPVYKVEVKTTLPANTQAKVVITDENGRSTEQTVVIGADGKVAVDVNGKDSAGNPLSAKATIKLVVPDTEYSSDAIQVNTASAGYDTSRFAMSMPAIEVAVDRFLQALESQRAHGVAEQVIAQRKLERFDWYVTNLAQLQGQPLTAAALEGARQRFGLATDKLA